VGGRGKPCGREDAPKQTGLSLGAEKISTHPLRGVAVLDGWECVAAFASVQSRAPAVVAVLDGWECVAAVPRTATTYSSPRTYTCALAQLKQMKATALAMLALAVVPFAGDVDMDSRFD